MQISDRIYYLWQQYVGDCATPAQLEELRDWLDQPQNTEAAKQHLIDFLIQSKPLLSHSEPRLRNILQKIRATEPAIAGSSGKQPTYRLNRNWFRYAAAAAVLAIVATGVVLLTNKKSGQSVASGNGYSQNDLLPGGDKAVLTLSDGSKIILDSASNGVLTHQGNATVVKLSNGKLAYSLNGAATGKEGVYNTMTTPRGGKYQLRLPDGTDVWLNAESSITYPTTFTGTSRKIALTGEAYFEVAKDKTKPFIVNVNNRSEVEVLGTHFNINSYSDESGIKTTLLEGSVRVTNGVAVVGPGVILRPGQQSSITANVNGISITNDADLEQVLAWKNGYFHFNRADIRTVMRQIARWYDVEVVYEGTVPDDKFVGELPMDANASQVLSALEKIGVHFRIEEKRIVVTQ
ncbi:MAG TPA: FecR domain-containing protein [Chitinophagaceae bacterium]|nr:FecR domain-containing protein [Chitinophagaceae bacterium]